MPKLTKTFMLILTTLGMLLLSGCAAFGNNTPYAQEQVVIQDNMSQYEKFAAVSEQGFTIPGLSQDMIPQGIDYVAEKDWFIISNYFRDKNASVLTVVDAITGEMVKAVRLANIDGQKHISHVGGVAAGLENLWISSDSTLFRVSLASIEKAEHMNTVRIEEEIAIPTKGSYANVSNGILWVGEFDHTADGYDTATEHHMQARDGMRHQSICVGYVLQEDETAFTRAEDGIAIPDYVLSTTNRIQGLAQSSDGSFLLSQSYGRGNDSTLYAYGPVLQEPAHGSMEIGQTTVPLWFLDGVSQTGELQTAPMTEGVCVVDDNLYVLFESGASYYRKNGAVNPTDQVWRVSVAALTVAEK